MGGVRQSEDQSEDRLETAVHSSAALGFLQIAPVLVLWGSGNDEGKPRERGGWPPVIRWSAWAGLGFGVPPGTSEPRPTWGRVRPSSCSVLVWPPGQPQQRH